MMTMVMMMMSDDDSDEDVWCMGMLMWWWWCMMMRLVYDDEVDVWWWWFDDMVIVLFIFPIPARSHPLTISIAAMRPPKWDHSKPPTLRAVRWLLQNVSHKHLRQQLAMNSEHIDTLCVYIYICILISLYTMSYLMIVQSMAPSVPRSRPTRRQCTGSSIADNIRQIHVPATCDTFETHSSI